MAHGFNSAISGEMDIRSTRLLLLMLRPSWGSFSRSSSILLGPGGDQSPPSPSSLKFRPGGRWGRGKWRGGDRGTNEGLLDSLFLGVCTSRWGFSWGWSLGGDNRGCSLSLSLGSGQLSCIPMVNSNTIVRNSEPVTITRCFSFIAHPELPDDLYPPVIKRKGGVSSQQHCCACRQYTASVCMCVCVWSVVRLFSSFVHCDRWPWRLAHRSLSHIFSPNP